MPTTDYDAARDALRIARAAHTEARYARIRAQAAEDTARATLNLAEDRWSKAMAEARRAEDGWYDEDTGTYQLPRRMSGTQKHELIQAVQREEAREDPR